MYYKWRDQLLTDGAKLFEQGGMDHVRERLERENRQLKETIGKLTIDLKKTIGKTARHEEFSEPCITGANPTAEGGASILGLSLHLGISQISCKASG